MKVAPLALAALVLLAACAHADDARFVTTLTPTGFVDAVKTAIPVLEKKFSDTALPNQSGETDAGALGKVDYTLTNIVVRDLSLPSGKAVLSSAGIGVQLADVSVQVTGDFSYRRKDWPHTGDHGSFTVVPSDGTIEVTVVLGSDGGKLTVSTADDSVDFANYDIKISSHLSWLYDLMKKLFSGSIRDTLNKEIASEISSVVKSEGAAIASHSGQNFTVGSGDLEIGIDILLASSPILSASTGMTVRDEAAAHPVKTLQHCPLPAHSLPNSVSSLASESVLALVDQSLVNCMMWAEHEQSGFFYAITDAMIPKGIALRMTTNSWAQFFPKLGQMYPNMNMVADFSTSVPPVMDFTTGKIVATAHTLLNYSVVFDPTDYIPVFTLGIDFGANVQPVLDTSGATPVLQPNVSLTDVNVTLVSSDMGTLNVSRLATFVKELTPIANAAITQALGDGFPMPSVANLKFLNPKLQVVDDYIAVGAGYSYTPPALAEDDDASVIDLRAAVASEDKQQLAARRLRGSA